MFNNYVILRRVRQHIFQSSLSSIHLASAAKLSTSTTRARTPTNVVVGWPFDRCPRACDGSHSPSLPAGRLVTIVSLTCTRLHVWLERLAAFCHGTVSGSIFKSIDSIGDLIQGGFTVELHVNYWLRTSHRFNKAVVAVMGWFATNIIENGLSRPL